MYHKGELDRIFLPIIFTKDQREKLLEFKINRVDHPEPLVLDLYPSQKKELFKIQNPRSRFSENELDAKYNEWIRDKNPDEEGTWVFYPWSNRLIHLLDKEEFITLRTSRNHYRITPKEQEILSNKTIGIVGLSVGHSVALSIATERICGKLKLADFDTLELSNLNRIKTGLHNIGLNKCVVTAREILEIDPFIEIECFLEGIHPDNLPHFLTDGGKLDILIDECDDVEIKLLCRRLARESMIPVIMETSDRGMLDVERFDLENSRPIFHGLVSGIPPEKLTNLSPQDRIPLVMKIVDALNGSVRGRASLLELGQTIGTWPQLASAVTLGGGVVTDVSRRILLDQFTDSGRYYVDLDQIITNRDPKTREDPETNAPKAFHLPDAIRIADSLPMRPITRQPNEQELHQIIEGAGRAPSSGNEQPWKWVFRRGRLHLFHDQARSGSFSNVDNLSAYLALGAAYENVILKSNQLGFGIEGHILPLPSEPQLAATLYFRDQSTRGIEQVTSPLLADFITQRNTNANHGTITELESASKQQLEAVAKTTENVQLSILTDPQIIGQLGTVVGACDQVYLLNERGHQEYFERNTRWTPEEYSQTQDGVPFQVPVQATALAGAMHLLRDKNVARALGTLGGGSVLALASNHMVRTASGVGLLTVSKQSPEIFFQAGRTMQEIWLNATQLGYAVQPIFKPVSLFRRLGSGDGLEEQEIFSLNDLKENFRNITNLQKNEIEVFLFLIKKADEQMIRAKRLPLNEILFLVNDNI